MNLEDFNNALHQLGVNMKDSTIRKYIYTYKVVPEPKVSSLGRGKGRKSEYSDESLEQMYAARKLLSGPIQTTVATLPSVRDFALKLLEDNTLNIDSSHLLKIGINANDLGYLMELWINYCEEAKPIYTKYRVDIYSKKNSPIQFNLSCLKVPRTRPRNLNRKYSSPTSPTQKSVTKFASPPLP